MEKFIDLLHRQPLLNGGLLLLFASAVILPHNIVGRFIVSFIAHMPRSQMDATVLGTGFILLILVGIPFLRQVIQHPAQKEIAAYTLITLSLVVISYLMLFVLPTEIAHFPQYAGMAILVFPFSRRFGQALFFATLIGAVDEAYQYFYLAPELTGYYDWNDVVSDFLGAALGLIYIWAFLKEYEGKQALSWKRNPAVWTAIGLMVLGMLLYAGGLLHISLPSDPEVKGILMEQIPLEEFWRISTVPGKPRFHILRSWEGLLVLGVLFGLYQGLGRRWKRRLSEGEE